MQYDIFSRSSSCTSLKEINTRDSIDYISTIKRIPCSSFRHRSQRFLPLLQQLHICGSLAVRTKGNRCRPRIALFRLQISQQIDVPDKSSQKESTVGVGCQHNFIEKKLTAQPQPGQKVRQNNLLYKHYRQQLQLAHMTSMTGRETIDSCHSFS